MLQFTFWSDSENRIVTKNEDELSHREKAHIIALDKDCMIQVVKPTCRKCGFMICSCGSEYYEAPRLRDLIMLPQENAEEKRERLMFVSEVERVLYAAWY